MPLYHCTVAADRTSLEQRARIAEAITRIHCEITSAPPAFVHAFFVEAGSGKLSEAQQAVVVGSIRAGRTAAQKEQLVAEMRRAIAAILACDESAIVVATIDVPARWIMEGGEIMPEPGAEAAWLARHS
jgi:phenylpyruvate tautomerase PptA (4-oxalocrotonate tautomerase family)